MRGTEKDGQEFPDIGYMQNKVALRTPGIVPFQQGRDKGGRLIRMLPAKEK